MYKCDHDNNDENSINMCLFFNLKVKSYLHLSNKKSEKKVEIIKLTL